MRRSSIFAATLAVAFSLGAPDGAASQLVLGFGGGVASSTWGGADADDVVGTDIEKGSRTGFRFGGFLAIPVGSRLSIVPAAFFSQKGAMYSEGSDELTAKIDYFEIPVLASISLTGPESSVGFSIHAGPALAFEAGCDIEVSDASSTASVDCDTFGLDERQSTDLGLVAGASVSFPLTEAVSILVSGGANFGMRTLDTSTDPSDIKNRSYSLSAFAAFPLGG